MKYCKYCGNPNDDNAEFCKICGKGISNIKTQQDSLVKQDSLAADKKEKGRSRGKIVVLLAACLVALGSAVFITADRYGLFSGPLEIITQPENLKISEGEEAAIHVETSGKRTSYQWQFKKAGQNDWKNCELDGSATDKLSLSGEKSEEGFYRCVINNRRGDVLISDEIELEVMRSLKIIRQLQDTTVLEHDAAEFQIEAYGDEIEYDWQVNKGKENSKDNWQSFRGTSDKNSLVIEADRKNNGEQYRCVIKDKWGEELISEPALLTVKTPLKITKEPENKTFEAGNNSIISIKADGDDITYQWQVCKNGENVWKDADGEGADTEKLKINVTKETDGDRYRCLLADKWGDELTSDTAEISVHISLKIISQPETAIVKPGDPIEFVIEAVGEKLQYRWQSCPDGSVKWEDCTEGGSKTSRLILDESEWRFRNGARFRCIVTDVSDKSVISDTAVLFAKSSYSDHQAGNTINKTSLADYVESYAQEKDCILTCPYFETTDPAYRYSEYAVITLPDEIHDLMEYEGGFDFTDDTHNDLFHYTYHDYYRSMADYTNGEIESWMTGDYPLEEYHEGDLIVNDKGGDPHRVYYLYFLTPYDGYILAAFEERWEDQEYPLIFDLHIYGNRIMNDMECERMITEAYQGISFIN